MGTGFKKAIVFFIVCVLTATAGNIVFGERSPVHDPDLVGVWSANSSDIYEFTADGVFILDGQVKYKYDAAEGEWHYWTAANPNVKVTAGYKVSGDKKSLDLNLKKGNPKAKLIRIK